MSYQLHSNFKISIVNVNIIITFVLSIMLLLFLLPLIRTKDILKLKRILGSRTSKKVKIGLQLYFKFQKRIQEEVEKRTEYYEDEYGYGHLQASTEAVNDLNLIDFEEYSLIRKELARRGEWQ